GQSARLLPSFTVRHHAGAVTAKRIHALRSLVCEWSSSIQLSSAQLVRAQPCASEVNMPAIAVRISARVASAASIGLLTITFGTAHAQPELPAVQGSIQFFRRDVRADELSIRARPITTVDALPTEISPGHINPKKINFNPTTGVLIVRAVETATPGLFTFSF